MARSCFQDEGGANPEEDGHQTECTFPTHLQGNWSVPYHWDNLSVNSNIINGLRFKQATGIFVDTFHCYKLDENIFIIQSTGGPNNDRPTYLCWKFVQVTSDIFFLYHTTASVPNETKIIQAWNKTGVNYASTNDTDVCSKARSSVSYLPFFRKEIELWRNVPRCPTFEVMSYWDCLKSPYICESADHHLRKPESTIMLCLGFRLKCSFLYLEHIELDGNKVICIKGQDRYGSFTVGLYLGVCKDLMLDQNIKCSSPPESIYPSCPDSAPDQVATSSFLMVFWSSGILLVERIIFV